MLPSAKKLLAAIVASFSGDSGDKGAWDWGDNTVTAWPNAAVYQMWQAWQKHGQLPSAGGWLDQPLVLLVQMEAINTVVETMRYKNSKGAKWETMTPLQLDIVRELNG